MDSLRLLTRGSGFRVNSKPFAVSHPRPSAGKEPDADSDSSISRRKRKRTEFEDDTNGSLGVLSSDEIRKLQNLHKIKITDLKSLHSHHGSESRKSQKEALRLYPQPLQRFSNLRHAQVNASLLSNVAEQGYKEPTEVQLATIPLLTAHLEAEPDLLTVAPTGSGKTLAFLLPLINKISKSHQDEEKDKPSRQVAALILAPTKELVHQIVNEGRKFAARTGVRATVFKKGMRLHDDISAHDDQDAEDLEAEESASETVVKSDVLVSTPLSLLHAITPTGSETARPLPNIVSFVLDEADVLLDPLFRSQTLAIWSACTNPSLRTSLWSATIGSNIEELTIDTITSRQVSLSIDPSSRPPLMRCIIGLKDSSLPNITHKLVYASTETGKLTGLRQLIRPPPSNIGTSLKEPRPEPILRPPFLIFTQTVPRAQALHDELQYDIPPSTNSEVPSRITVLHSSLSATQRSRIMQHFRLGKIWILITTDLLSRGIDFRGVNGVVNYDIPTTSASYVHRAGRTGRAGRKGGVCVTYYTKEDVMYLRPIVNVIEKSQKIHNDAHSGEDVKNAIPTWLRDSLPRLTKEAKKELKERGVAVRRAVKQSDDKKEKRVKGRNLIGTKSGYERQLEERRNGMIEGSKRRKRKDEYADGSDSEEDDSFAGFD